MHDGGGLEHGSFFWCDLSTFDVDRTKAFYRDILGWAYTQDTQPDGAPYYLASQDDAFRAALYQMPKKFKNMGMPSFWMSYIAVDNAQATADLAKSLGGIVEVGPIPFGDGASIALIRDPLGAGFTVCEGAAGMGGGRAKAAGAMAWNALYVSDASSVAPFYEALFGWRVSDQADSQGAHSILTASGKPEASLYELPDAVRGKFQFWGVHFAVSDLNAAKQKVLSAGGEVLSDEPDQLLAKDPDGAAFFLVPATQQEWDTKGPAANRVQTYPWKAATALIVLWAAALLDSNALLGALFLLWTIPALTRGETHFFDHIRRQDRPGLFWMLVVSWGLMSALLITLDIPGLWDV